MLNFLLDIAPDKSQLLLTIKLAGILREKKQEVYYTYTSNPAFTPVLYDKGISNCVLYPDDFRWLKPDLTLLDCRHAAHASLYRQLAIDYIFIAMQLPDQKNIQDKDISILYLPPTPYLSSGSGPRLETLTKRLQDIKKDKERNIIVGLLGKGNKNSKILEDFYRVIKRSSIRKLPIILFTLNDFNVPGYVVCYGIHESRFIIWEPEFGLMQYWADEMKTLWIKGIALPLFPTQDFMNSANLHLKWWEIYSWSKLWKRKVEHWYEYIWLNVPLFRQMVYKLGKNK